MMTRMEGNRTFVLLSHCNTVMMVNTHLLTQSPVRRCMAECAMEYLLPLTLPVALQIAQPL